MRPGRAILPAFDSRHGILLAATVALFGLMLALRINGWSMPIWHKIIDGSAPREVLWGEPREIRSDDFLLDLDESLAQRRAVPAFPLVNPDIGSGQFMGAPISVPSGAFFTLFRPFTWGFFIGPDAGLAWKWWGLELGLFYSLFLVFMLVSRGWFAVSLWAGLAAVFSPYFQFWSFHKAEITIHWAGAFVAGACILAARSRPAIWAAGAFLGWSLAAMGLDHMYPPIFVVLGWLLVFAAAAWAWTNRRLLPWRERIGTRLAAAAAAVAIAGGAFAFFWIRYRPYIAAMSHTVYPGQRFSTGGGLPLWALFGHDLLAEIWNPQTPWMTNICESASFILLFPAVWMFTLLMALRGRRGWDPWVVILAPYFIALLIFGYWGFPGWLAHLTLFGMVTANRTQLGLGLADLLMLVAAAAGLRANPAPGRPVRLALLAGWIVLQGVFAIWFRSHWPSLGWPGVALGLAFQAVLVGLFWVLRRPVWSLAVLAAASFLYTAWFNPWVRGGGDYILHNPLSRAIRAIAQSDRNQHRWVVFGDMRMNNLPRMLGVKSIGGYEGVPDFNIWKAFDPDGRYRDVYNQSAYSAFVWGGAEASFTTVWPGYFHVSVDPASPAFAALGVRYFLVCDEPEARNFAARGGFRELFHEPGRAIFERR